MNGICLYCVMWTEVADTNHGLICANCFLGVVTGRFSFADKKIREKVDWKRDGF